MGFHFDYVKTPDNLMIRWGHAPTVAVPARGTVLLLNGRTEYMEKYGEVAEELNQRGFAVYSCDWRGQGLSDRLLADGQKGHVRGFEDYLTDLEQVMAIVNRHQAPEPFILMGHSMGGHIAARFLERHPDVFARVVMTSPMIDIQLPALLPRYLLRLMVRMAVGRGLQGAYVPGSGEFNARERRFDGNPLTSDRARFERHIAMIEDNPRLAVGGVTYGWLAAAFRSIDHVATATFAGAFPVPLLMVTAGEDQIVSLPAQARFCRHVPDCHWTRIEGARHEVLVETDTRRALFWEAFDGFLAG